MSQTVQLITTLKRQLKAHGVTYAQVAIHLKKSEATIKRQFSQQNFSLRTLESICDLIELDVAELAQAAEDAESGLRQLSVAQETDIIADPRRLLIAACVLNHWTLAQIVTIYRIRKAECIKHLLQLDRLGLIRLMPENRVKLRIARDFTWLPDGPIHRFFRDHAQTDFLNARFGGPGEVLRFRHAMLTPSANARFQQRLHRLLQEFSELHEDCLASPVEARYGTSLLVAMRPWEPAEFESLRQAPDSRAFPVVKKDD